MFTLYNVKIYMSMSEFLYYLMETLDIRRDFCMIRLNVLELLQQRGHTKYWLYKQLGMSYQNFNKMVNNQTASIRYENIEAICQLLECTPNELFRFEEEEPDRNQIKKQ